MSWRGSIRKEVARWLKCMAASTPGGRLYRGASGRVDSTCCARTAGSPEPELFLSGLQPIFRHAATTLPYPATHRTRQDTIGKAQCIGDRRWTHCRIQRGKRFLRRISQGDWTEPKHLSP